VGFGMGSGEMEAGRVLSASLFLCGKVFVG